MVVVGGSNGTGELFSFDTGVVQVGQVDVSHLVSVPQQDVDSVVVLQEFRHLVGVGIDIIFTFVEPVV